MYTLSAEYFATGEGTHYMVLITRGYGPDDGRTNAKKEFARIFGDYMATGVTIREGIDFDFPGAKYLLSDALRVNIIEWEKEAGGLEYHAGFHVNFS